MDRHLEKIRGLIEGKGITLKEASLAVGKNHAYLHQFVHKGTPKHLPETVRIKLARYLHVEEKELLAPGQVATLSSVGVDDGEYVMVPAYNIHASAGHGSVVERQNVLYHLSFRADWLKRMTTASPEHLAVISVTGDSMEPTLSAEDTVLVDMTMRSAWEDGIYVLNYDESLRVKRLRIDPIRRLVRIISDNPAYDPVDNLQAADVKIFGRVIWLGRKL